MIDEKLMASLDILATKCLNNDVRDNVCLNEDHEEDEGGQAGDDEGQEG